MERNITNRSVRTFDHGRSIAFIRAFSRPPACEQIDRLREKTSKARSETEAIAQKRQEADDTRKGLLKKLELQRLGR